MIASRIKLQCPGAKSKNDWALRRILYNGLGLLLLISPHVSAFQATFSAVSCFPRDHAVPITCLQSTASNTFDVDKALFCAGLAFDAYVEPDPDSSRWERGVSDIMCYLLLAFRFPLHLSYFSFLLAIIVQRNECGFCFERLYPKSIQGNG